METIDLIHTYNALVLKARKMPKRLRYSCMPSQTSTRQIMLDEIQRRALSESGPSILLQLEH